MRLSLKNMLISFAIALLAFSIVMTCICVGIYRSRIHERIVEGEGSVSHVFPSYRCRYNFSKTTVYVDGSEEFTFGALVGVDEKEKLIVVTPFLSDLPIRYKNSIYFVSSIVKSEGENELLNIISVLTGIVANDILLESFLSYDPVDTVEDLIAYLSQAYEGYTIQKIEVVLDDDGVADNHKTREQFFTFASK